MARIEVEFGDLGRFGMVGDIRPYQLPPEAWSELINVRVKDDSIARMGGWAQVFGTPLYVPHYAIPVIHRDTTYWIYTDLQHAAVYDGSGHYDITRSAAPYNTFETRFWNGTILGGIPVINNGNDPPQYWPAFNIATRLEDIVDWPTGMKTKLIRTLSSHLVALNITEGQITYPMRIRWSVSAEPGTIPQSWDVDDPTNNAGETDIAEGEGSAILEALPLQNRLFIYKDKSIHYMTRLGGRDVMDVKMFASDTGILAERCACVLPDGLQHVVVTQDDVVIHNGASMRSVIDEKMRIWLFTRIDPLNFRTSFMFAHAAFKEVWFCYPSIGNSQPNEAIVGNYQKGEWVWSYATGITFRNAATGSIQTPDPRIWDTIVNVWDVEGGPWDNLQRRKVLLCATNSNKFLLLDSGLTRDGAAFTATARREALGVVGRKRSGEWIEDFSVGKLCHRIWPKIVGGPVNIRVGGQPHVNGETTYGTAQSFNPGTQQAAGSGALFTDHNSSGKAIVVEFETTASVAWTLDGYKIEMSRLGKFM